MKLNIKLSFLAVFGLLCGIATAATSITPDMPNGEYDSIVNDSGTSVTLENKALTLTGTGDVFNQTVNNSATHVKSGSIAVSNEGDVSVGKSSNAEKKTNKALVLTDGASMTGIGGFVVAAKEAGNVLAITNATISAKTFSIDNGGCQGVNSVFAGPNAKISISGEFTTEKGPTGKSTAGAVFRMAGADAEISAGTANIGAVSGTSFVVADGAKATFTTLNVGVDGYEDVSGVQVDVLNATMNVTGALSFGKAAGTKGHTLVVGGENAALNHTTSSKNDIFGLGSDCHIIVKDGAKLDFADVRQLFGNGTRGSSLEVLNGGSITAAKSVYLGYGEKGVALDCAKNRLIVGADASVTSTGGNVYVFDVNNELVVSNGIIATSGVYVGTDAKSGAYNQSTNATLVVQGSSPKITGIRFITAGVAPKIRFELARDDYSWSDEPARTAPINITVSKKANAITMVEGTVLEADVTRLAPARRGVPIPLITSDFAMSIPDSVIENANAKGAADRYKYMFALSGDRKTLNLTVESRGLVLVVQ